MLHCPDCQYLLSETHQREVYHCYNCDEDIGLEEITRESPEVWEASINPAFDNESLSAALEGRSEEVIDMRRVTDGGKPTIFPYTLDDLLYWVVKRKTGETVRYTLVNDAGIPGTKDGKSTSLILPGKTTAQSSYSDWCKHDPAELPTWDHPGSKAYPNPTRLFIADAAGVRAHKDDFEIVIDCGDVLSDYYAARVSKMLVGDPTLIQPLEQYTLDALAGPRVLKIGWSDRRAPLLHPKFWPALAKTIKGDVLINCQGGHGRSGTALVCLMMVYNPEYGAADAITHLRAIHCPRAIESNEQHAYIDEVADFLGRKADAKSIGSVTSFKEAFLVLDKPSAASYQKRIKGVK